MLFANCNDVEVWNFIMKKPDSLRFMVKLLTWSWRWSWNINVQSKFIYLSSCSLNLNTGHRKINIWTKALTQKQFAKMSAISMNYPSNPNFQVFLSPASLTLKMLHPTQMLFPKCMLRNLLEVIGHDSTRTRSQFMNTNIIEFFDTNNISIWLHIADSLRCEFNLALNYKWKTACACLHGQNILY